ncbi:hypothetical protein BAE44_0016652 [Dichanthelium oligosanthes]|uniref:Nuclease HARBI1 n=1 Tax=Dichanthelium oligosanthes TaxID=888268 RepID=A0A1E5VB00_9POAL|nr:hypothetical protein BAE44_0016652 [Dichanthelium oligosanthes]
MEEESEESEEELQDAAAACSVQELSNTMVQRRHRGSVPGRVPVMRNTMQGHIRIFSDYFAPNPVFNDDHFRRRFRMTKRLFCRILEAVTVHDYYFTQQYNAANQLGCSPLQKVTASLRMLAYGCSADSLDEDVRMGESSIIESLQHFVRAVVHVFGPYYLRRPTQEDIDRILLIAETRGSLACWAA